MPSVEPRLARRLIVIAIVGVAIAQAALRAWTCDDAYISFRYARNLVDGAGLVFNHGERVEGYTNLLWTLWIAVGLVVRVEPELWTAFWGVVFHAATVLLLLRLQDRLHDRLHDRLADRDRHAGGGAQAGTADLRRAGLPWAAAIAAVHPDMAIYASSGLEGSCFTFLVLAAFAVLVGEPQTPRRLLGAGLLHGAATLCRPDGVVFFVVAAGYVALGSRGAMARADGLAESAARRATNVLCHAGGFLTLAAPALLFRVAYYGDWVPNTYYAKSAHLAWYGQGLLYAGLYFFRYPALFVGPVLALGAWSRARAQAAARGAHRGRGLSRGAGLAAVSALAYTAAVVRVGGDFMFARLLLPATPFLLLLLEEALVGYLGAARRLQPFLFAALLLLTAAMRSPVRGDALLGGIVDEWAFYRQQDRAWRERADTLRRYLGDLPVGVAFLGTEARIVYRARLDPAVESSAGLTDAVVARQPLAERGRVGHEKRAPPAYLIGVRKLQIATHPKSTEVLGLEAWIPTVPIAFDRFEARVLRWDPALMSELRRRGARFDDFPGALDRYARDITRRSDTEVARDYERFRHFYFDHVSDPGREAVFLRRRGHSSGASEASEPDDSSVRN